MKCLVEIICFFSSEKEKTQCDEFVKIYGPVISELIAEMVDPEAICHYLGMCQTSLPMDQSTEEPSTVTYPNHGYVHLPIEDKPFDCTVCQFIISRMKHFANLNQTEEEILASLKKSCDLFSVVKLKEKCDNFLNQYESYIVQMISNDIDPKAACQSIGICKKSADLSPLSTRHQSTPPVSTTPLTTYGKCIFGMSYWCTSRQNAELCNVNKIVDSQINISGFLSFSVLRLSNCASVKYGRKEIRILSFNSKRKGSFFIHELIYQQIFRPVRKKLFFLVFVFFSDMSINNTRYLWSVVLLSRIMTVHIFNPISFFSSFKTI